MMNTHRPEVADVFRSHGTAFLEISGRSISKQQRRALKDLFLCRTAALGGHVRKCDQCDHQEISYNSCRNRHCPKCQGTARARWLEARAADLLNVPYFHVVFTLPDTLGPIALQNKRVLYEILFRSVSETLHTIAKEQKYLGAEIGFIALLHTWGQSMHFHPHVHCLVPGGGLSPEGKSWLSSGNKFFLPVRVLSRLFQKKFLAYLKEAYEKGSVSFFGQQKHRKNKPNWKRFVSALYDTNWVIYARPPFGSPAQVLKYLARYTHRVAISNQRMVSLRNGKVIFRWKDYADGNKEKSMTLDAVEFIRRFLLHVLPSGFMHIRHYGFLSNRNRKEKLPLCRILIEANEADQTSSASPEAETYDILKIDDLSICPSCKKGRMVMIERLNPNPEYKYSFWFSCMEAYDTS